MTKKITLLGNFRIIKISQRILSDFFFFLRNQLKLPKKVQIVSLINVPHGAYIWTILMLKSCRHTFYAHLKIDAIFTLRMLQGRKTRGGGKDCVRQHQNQNYMLLQFLKSPQAFFRHHPQERVVLDAGWRSQLPRPLGAQLVQSMTVWCASLGT